METLIEYLQGYDFAVVYFNGKEQTIDNPQFKQVLTEVCDKAYFSPALAIAKNADVYTRIRKGIWLELRYNSMQNYADMEFDRLLIEIKPNMYGFNIIRGIGDLYEGRCYYLNLSDDSTKLYKFLKSMS